VKPFSSGSSTPITCRSRVWLRVRVEIMGPGKYENAGKTQSVLLMITPMIVVNLRF
jgi:hypothetical protein